MDRGHKEREKVRGHRRERRDSDNGERDGKKRGEKREKGEVKNRKTNRSREGKTRLSISAIDFKVWLVSILTMK